MWTVIADGIAIVLCLAGIGFFAAGTVGLLRFPDVYTRLHALTKADNLGLGLVAIGLAMQSASWLVALKVLSVWILALAASATVCNLVAKSARDLGIPAWEKR